MQCKATNAQVARLRVEAYGKYAASVAAGNARLAIAWLRRVVMCDQELARRAKG